mmetsp:Transcript_24690/g.79856  ORF Transcript_24690/g.79856 Transcript_24690/m.79856 type:complete len:278 (-) Transcript_24690:499-1332(-)|eukprot:CAMPEP_0118920084 /NCGR_PEP_ID=MMETSP1166-20130328/18891_1 /TAXON_ID=1104430 /ORGANISM="Chrysoreinhardia sp, Strain CCMP3193" /LENGTH=277 /DNA_ID=CAMNT_0006860621 /DNA_START=466 /DNA_END=1302 /DNA_ORIENTATION=+
MARYRVSIPKDVSKSGLGALVARHFDTVNADEEAILARFFERLEGGGLDDSGDDVDDVDAVDEMEDVIAKPGEQVAAKVTLVDENGSWILASVLSYNRRAGTYQVQDEDDATKVIELAASRIRRLNDDGDNTAHDLQKGDRVLAIFPETTSFYRAIISKSPKRNANGHIYEVVLKFEDDEDDAGRTPHRRVNIRYVLREHYPSPTNRTAHRAFVTRTQIPSGSQSFGAVSFMRTEGTNLGHECQPVAIDHEMVESMKFHSSTHEERPSERSSTFLSS